MKKYKRILEEVDAIFISVATEEEVLNLLENYGSFGANLIYSSGLEHLYGKYFVRYDEYTYTIIGREEFEVKFKETTK